MFFKPSLNMDLPLKMMHEGTIQPVEFIHSIVVTHSRLPGWIRWGFLGILDLVTTLVVAIRPIAKPVSSKLKMSSSRIPYFIQTFSSCSNHPFITCGFSHFARWWLYCQENWVLTSSRHFMKFDTQFFPTGWNADGLVDWRRMLAISATWEGQGGAPRKSLDRIHSTRESSSIWESLWQLARFSTLYCLPLSLSRKVD